MSRVSTYLNFMEQTEEAFEFYRSVFGTEYVGPITRFGDVPGAGGAVELGEHERNLVMHVALPILGGHVIMATDMVRAFGHERRVGNNVTINLEPDTRAETERLYALLSEGSTEASGLSDMPWGAYWASCLDRYGIRWMFNCYEKAS